MNERWEVRPCKDRLGNTASYDICLPQERGSTGVAVVASVYSGEEVANKIAALWNAALEQSDAVMGEAFDLLEGLKHAWRKVDPAKSDAIAAGFARATGGIDVDYLIEQLGPPAPVQDDDAESKLVSRLVNLCERIQSCWQSPTGEPPPRRAKYFTPEWKDADTLLSAMVFIERSRLSPSTEEGVLRRALQPFADFADPYGYVPREHPITVGSPMAKRQLTMGDCLNARAALAGKSGEGGG